MFLLSADVFEKFFSTCLEYFRLDPRRYFSSPRLSWGVMLKITKIELDLISDIDIFIYRKSNERRYFLHC